MSNGFKVPFMGKVINPPNPRRVSAECKGTLSCVKQINTVAKWLSKRGWNVIFEKGSEPLVVPALRNVIIDSGSSKPTMLYSILHEAGHIVINSKANYSQKYSDGYVRFDNGKNTRSLMHKVDVLAEELDAWDMGEAIAKELKIKLDMRGYKAERNRSIKTYAKWVVE